MKHATIRYKQAMKKQFRDRSYGLVSLGVVNKYAQSSLQLSGLYYLSNTQNVLKLGDVQNEYATFEENQVRADGSCIFPPKNDEYFQLALGVGIVGESIGSTIRVSFDNAYDIKGLTIDFGDNYPTEFKVTNGSDEYTYVANGGKFTCTDTFDSSTYLEIIPIHFVNGDNKRLRINYLLMGVGINFNNDDITSIDLNQSVSYVSEELPSTSLTVKVLDPNNLFNVDDESSFINYLAGGQELTFSIGQTLEDGTIEYIDMPLTYIKSWAASKGNMSFTATDRLATMTGIYKDGNTIHERTLYEDAIAVLTDAGLEPDEYFVDSCLQDITVVNPLPEVSYAQCLQIIANAGRCSLRQSVRGQIMLEGNFENIIEPTDLDISVNEESPWSNIENTRFGTDVVYADFTSNFVPADGSMLFLPGDTSLYSEDTTFVSAEISNELGRFNTNPVITLELPARYTYYGMKILFNGNPPKEMKVQTYYDDELLNTKVYTDMTNDFNIVDEFVGFNKLVFTFTKAYPCDRILVKKIALGEITEYQLDKLTMLEEPVGALDAKVKEVRVKVFTFNEPQEEGESPQAVDDNVFYTHTINTTGQVVTFENQLISDINHAQQVAEWMSNYYANNIMYNVKYRGEPRLDAADIIYLESDIVNNLQVEIESLNLSFNGALSGKLNLRRATNMLQEES